MANETVKVKVTGVVWLLALVALIVLGALWGWLALTDHYADEDVWLCLDSRTTCEITIDG
jgi:F0F1-type ATP synthase assembly protein I